MRFAKLIYRNLLRNPVRAALTMVLLATIFFFVIVMMGILHSFTGVTEEGLNRLVSENAIALTNKLPVAYASKIREIPGVVDVCKQSWIGNYYKDKRNYFTNYAVDSDHFATVFDDYKVDPQQLQAWKTDRRGALVGRELMQRFGWKLGQRITLVHNIVPYDADLTIRGIVDHPVGGGALFFHWDYHQEASPSAAQNVGTIWIKVKDRSLLTPIAQQIDSAFKNSEAPTETYTEKDYKATQVAAIGNVTLLFTALSACAIVMVIALAAITLSMAARERVTEIAVLKAIGFEKWRVLAMILAEFMLMTFAGGVAGIVAAELIFQFVNIAKITDGAVNGFAITAPTVAACALIACAVGLIAGGFPAFRASSLSVVDGLRRVV